MKKKTAIVLAIILVLALSSVYFLSTRTQPDIDGDTDMNEPTTMNDPININETTNDTAAPEVVAFEAVSEPLRPFPQRGRDNGLMVELLLPPGATQHPTEAEEVDLQILRQFAQLVDNTEGSPPGSPAGRANALFENFGGTNSVYLVDPATRGRENKNDFRMVTFIGTGTGGNAVRDGSYRVTVCEAMGYGMLMLVHLAGSEDIILGGEFGQRTMRDVLLAGLPAPLRYEFSSDPNAPNAVSFQTYFDAMFRSLRFWPSHPIDLETGARGHYTNATIVNANIYRDGRGEDNMRSYQMAWSIHNVHDDVHDADNFFRREPGASTATDGTMDMAYALILASEQWGDAPAWDPVCHYSRTPGHTYLEWATRMVGEIWESTVHHSRHLGTSTASNENAGYFLKIGNWAGSNARTGHLTRPSDHMMQHLRAFKAICQNPHSDWQRVINVTYDSHRFVRQHTDVPGREPGAMPNSGVLPDFMRFDPENSTPQPDGTGNVWLLPTQGEGNSRGERFHETYFDGASHWNACRVPWRLGAGMLFAGYNRYEEITIGALHDFHVGLGLAWEGAVRGRWLDGTSASSGAAGNNAFTGPMLVPAAIFGAQGRPNAARGREWFHDGWTVATTSRAVNPNSFNSYGDYINIQAMIAASGNEWTPVGSSLTIINGTTVDGFDYVRRVVPGARVPLRCDDAEFSFWEVEGADFWPGYDHSTAATVIKMPLHQDVVATAVVGGKVERFPLTASYTQGGTVSRQHYPRELYPGQNIELRAMADPGFRFVNWTGSGIDILRSTAAALEVAMPANAAGIMATFEQIPTHRLTVEDGGFGATSDSLRFEGLAVAINAGTREGYAFDGWTSSPEVDFVDAHSAAASFIMPANAVTVTASWYALDPGVLNTGVVFAHIYTESAGEPLGFHSAASGLYAEFDATQHQDVVLTLPPWPAGSEGELHSLHRDIYVALPLTPMGQALDVTLYSIRINDQHVFGPMQTHTPPGPRPFEPGSVGTLNPVTIAESGNANATAADAFAEANMLLRTFYPPAGAFRIYEDDVVEVVVRVGDGG